MSRPLPCRAARARCLLAGTALGLGLIGCDDSTGPGEPGVRCAEVSADAAPFATTRSEITVLGHGRSDERFTAEVAARGGFAYTTTWNTRGNNRGNAVKVWDVSGSPQLVDSLIIADAATTGDVQISDDGRWLVVATEFETGSIVVYDLENPAKPKLVARHMSEDTQDFGVHTAKLYRDGASGNLYAFLSVNDGDRPSRLVVVDLSDPANPREVLVRAMGNPFIHDVFVRDGLLFTALWHDGMTIWDIGGGGRGGSPESPVEISNIKTVGSVNPGSPYVHNMWWFHNPENGEKRYVFVGEEAPGVIGSSFGGDIHVVDISDIERPCEVAFYHVDRAGTHNFTMDEASGILYAAFYNAGVRALDVRGDLSDCAAEHRAADGRCDLALAGREAGFALDDGSVQIWGVAKIGDSLYASDMLSGIFKLDVSALAR